jgi:WhiB family redox-sensing transcriptional regulator
VNLTDMHDDWRSLGACASAQSDLFFPLSSASVCAPQIAAAKAICARCQVRRQCLSFALQTRQQHGIWGGFTEDERSKEMRRGAEGLAALQARVAL